MKTKIFTSVLAVLFIIAATVLIIMDLISLQGLFIMSIFCLLFFFLGMAWGKNLFFSLAHGQIYRYLGHSNKVLFLKETTEEVVSHPITENSEETIELQFGVYDNKQIVVKNELPRLFIGSVFGSQHNLHPGDMCIAVEREGKMGIEKLN